MKRRKEIFSRRFSASRRLPFLLLTAAIAGCKASSPPENIPHYESMNETSALSVLAERSKAIKTISGSGTLTLTQPNGDSVRLDLAVVMHPPTNARLRAYKFGQAVFDLTLNSDGLFLVSSREGEQKEKITQAGNTAGQVTKTWSLLNGRFFAEENLVAKNDGDHLIIRRHQNNEPDILCTVKRDTLTPRLYQILDEKGQTRFTLALDHYQEFNGLLWPTQMTANSDNGKVVVELSDIELNGEIPPNAFKPPRRAEKLP